MPTPFGDLALSGAWTGVRPVMITVVCLVLAKSLASLRDATAAARRSTIDATWLARRSVDDEEAGAELRHDAMNSLAAVRGAVWMLCDPEGGPAATPALTRALEGELDNLEQLIRRKTPPEATHGDGDLVATPAAPGEGAGAREPVGARDLPRRS